jgi:hypothetical protein
MGDVLGTGALTIGRAGCLITAMASVLADCGVDTDPGRLNCWLTANCGYVDDDLFAFVSVAPLGLELSLRLECSARPAPIDVLRDALLGGQYAVLLVDFSPGGAVQPHWVRLLDTDEWRIMDPWRPPGEEGRTLADYYAAGWDAARAIMGLALYRAGPRPEAAPRGMARGPVQGQHYLWEYCVEPMQ